VTSCCYPAARGIVRSVTFRGLHFLNPAAVFETSAFVLSKKKKLPRNSHLTLNTSHFHYKEQSVCAIYKSNRCRENLRVNINHCGQNVEILGDESFVRVFDCAESVLAREHNALLLTGVQCHDVSVNVICLKQLSTCARRRLLSLTVDVIYFTSLFFVM
jgi:hypothetical protein